MYAKLCICFLLTHQLTLFRKRITNFLFDKQYLLVNSSMMDTALYQERATLIRQMLVPLFLHYLVTHKSRFTDMFYFLLFPVFSSTLPPAARTLQPSTPRRKVQELGLLITFK